MIGMGGAGPATMSARTPYPMAPARPMAGPATALQTLSSRFGAPAMPRQGPGDMSVPSMRAPGMGPMGPEPGRPMLPRAGMGHMPLGRRPMGRMGHRMAGRGGYR